MYSYFGVNSVFFMSYPIILQGYKSDANIYSSSSVPIVSSARSDTRSSSSVPIASSSHISSSAPEVFSSKSGRGGDTAFVHVQQGTNVNDPRRYGVPQPLTDTRLAGNSDGVLSTVTNMYARPFVNHAETYYCRACGQKQQVPTGEAPNGAQVHVTWCMKCRATNFVPTTQAQPLVVSSSSSSVSSNNVVAPNSEATSGDSDYESDCLEYDSEGGVPIDDDTGGLTEREFT